MTRDEIKAEAAKLGLRVRDNLIDDWFENVLVFAAGVLLGWYGHALSAMLK